MNTRTQQILGELSTLPGLETSKVYYETLLKGVEMTIEGIDGMLASKVTLIDTNKQKYEQGKLIVEKCDWESQRNVYQNHLQQKIESIKHTQKIHEEVTIECNRDFDAVYDKAKIQSDKSEDLRSVLSVAEGRIEEVLADQTQKNNLYLQILTYLK